MQTTHRSLETVRTERRWNDTYEKAQHFLNVATILWLGQKIGVECCLCIENN